MTIKSIDNDIEYNESLVEELDSTHKELLEAMNRAHVDVAKYTELIDAWKNSIKLWEELASPEVSASPTAKVAPEPSEECSKEIMAELGTAQDQLATMKVKLEYNVALSEKLHIYMATNNATRIAYSNAAIALRNLKAIDK